MPSTKTHCFFCLFLLLWLSAWMVLSWGAVQDDAFIHFRYANNLFAHSFVTYDGVHPNYGSSSLLYIAILALLRTMTESPHLPRALSSVVHVLLFYGLAIALGTYVPRRAMAARGASALLLALLVTPSAVRWLDDGMETGLVVAVVAALTWMVHERSGSRLQAPILGVLAFVAVMLRTELVLLCGVGILILFFEYWRGAGGLGDRGRRNNPTLSQRRERMGYPASIGPIVAIAAGSLTALAVIVGKMHVLLPDTAVAKSHGIGHWLNPIQDTAVTLSGAFSFGAGMMVFWLLTLGLVALRGGLTWRTALANCCCPVVLVLSSLRGQEIQGVRYFAWTFMASIIWNILELAEMVDETVLWSLADSRGIVLLYLFAGLLAVELPAESVTMRRVLTRRSETTRVFVSQHLDVLRMRRGVASDIGYIGYFTGAQICDLAGLVNGREAARRSSKERASVCAQTSPDFMFLNRSQYGPMAAVTGMDDWKVCGEYDFANVRALDRHYLFVRPEIAGEVCRATGRQQQTVAEIFRPALLARQTDETGE